jgi:histidyl-tRNA synthetase
MAQPQFTTHNGMVDILPEESPKWQFLEQLIRNTARKFHFQEIRTPVMEQTGLIARGIGELTDIVSKEMFAFNRGEDQYVLRPEGTAPVARAFVEHRLDQRGGVQKLFYIGPMFRAERPQKGRQRQFHQFGAELIGSADPVADAEIIAFMVEVYREVGIVNTTLKINSVGDPESRRTYKEALIAYFTPFREQLSDISKTRLETNPMRILDSKEKEDQPFVEGAPIITDFLNEESLLHYIEVKKHLDALGISYQETPRLVRGLDYYSKTAFELVSPDLGSQDALGGGGRYDLLIEEIGGPATPAVGFASGMERLMIACEALNIELGGAKRLDVYVVTRGSEAVAFALSKLPALRALGLSASMDYSSRSIKAQMKEANRESARYSIIVGESELASGLFVFRDMDTSTEVTLHWDDILHQLNIQPIPIS